MQEIHYRGTGPVRVLVNGALVCEVAAGKVDGPELLAEQVAAARMLQVVPQLFARALARLKTIRNKEDHTTTQTAGKQADYTRGLLDGMEGLTLPYPTDEAVPPLPPESSPCYTEGYLTGECLRGVLQELQSLQAEVQSCSVEKAVCDGLGSGDSAREGAPAALPGQPGVRR